MPTSVVPLRRLVQAETPRVPNFIMLVGGGKSPLSDFTEAELKQIGDQFTKDLIHRAKDQAKGPDHGSPCG